MSKLACIFPGQGSQSTGMGLDLNNQHAHAKELFAQIDNHAGRSLSELCFNGPDEELKKTINTQPTILAASLVAWHCYKQAKGPMPHFVAGHSLGEFTALVASEALSVEDAVKLVSVRARLMEECPKGAMSAILGSGKEAIAAACQQASQDTGKVVIIANYNTREQLVISGDLQAVERAGELIKTAGGKVIPLPVGGAFHSPLMESAAIEFAQHISKANIKDAVIPVVQNFDAVHATASGALREKLIKQMPNSVRWCDTIEYLLNQGVDTFVEIGPGKALSGMVKKIDRSAKVHNVSDAESLKSTIEALKELAIL